MKIGVRIKLNVSQIDKARLFQGNKGVYLDATVFIDVDQKDQYDNNGMITQDISKEEKANGVQGNILGNVQVFWSDQQQAQQAPQQQGGFQQQQAPQQQGGFQQQQAPQQSPTQQLQEKRNAIQQQQPQYQAPQQAPAGSIDFDDDLPF